MFEDKSQILQKLKLDLQYTFQVLHAKTKAKKEHKTLATVFLSSLIMNLKIIMQHQLYGLVTLKHTLIRKILLPGQYIKHTFIYSVVFLQGIKLLISLSNIITYIGKD